MVLRNGVVRKRQYKEMMHTTGSAYAALEMLYDLKYCSLNRLGKCFVVHLVGRGVVPKFQFDYLY